VSDDPQKDPVQFKVQGLVLAFFALTSPLWFMALVHVAKGNTAVAAGLVGDWWPVALVIGVVLVAGSGIR
jgi:hypothetical protein